MESPAFVDQDLAIIGELDRGAFQGARCRAFEVNARESKAAAVARTLELLFSGEVVRRAAKMGAHRDQGEETARVLA